MTDPLADVCTALSRLSGDDLEVLFATSNLRHAPSPVLLGWVGHAADWEMNRRRGFDFRLAPPDEAIDPSEDAGAIAAAIALHDEFAAGDPAIARFFASTVDVLVGRVPRQ